jgi:anti-sigma regulatory factor (Ser/Thr protein kinase)
MTVTAFRLLPFTMPLGLVCQTWLNYGQVSRKQVLTHSLALIDGMLCPCLAMLALVPVFGMNGIYYALIVNGVVTVVYPMIYSIVVNRGIPKNLDRLLMIPDSFGAPEEDRLDISLHSDEEVVTIAEQVQRFCMEKGLDERKSYLSGLFLEEMAGNIVDHGFTKDKKEHSVDVRVVCKDGDVILRLKDDCIPFDPKQRADIVDPDDITKNFGIRIVYSMAKDITYQNILGLNVLTIRIS